MRIELKKTNFFTEWVVPILIALVLAFLINKFLIFKVKIPSESMVPTLNVGDRLFVTRIPGDKVVIKDGIVTVNGETLKENYIGTADNYSGEFEVPEGKYFFLGDNRYWSLDSRYWENPYIDGSKIKGKAQIKVYPWSEFGKIK